MLADMFEAFIGAIYLDKGLGLGPCRRLFAQVLFPRRADLPLRRCWLQVAEQVYVEPDPATQPDQADPLISASDSALLEFQRATSLRFSRFGLLRQAFTHPSFFLPRAGFSPPPKPPGCREHPHNQRLEFLGDALLQLASSDFLVHHFPEHQEGPLSLLRSSLVNNALICDVAATCGMHHCMRYHQDSMDAPGRARRGMLADSFEAFLGALFLDRQPLGMAYVKAFTMQMLFSLTQRTIDEQRWMDPKARLQFCLSKFNATHGLTGAGALEHFAVLNEYGPSHERMILVAATLTSSLSPRRAASRLRTAAWSALRAQEALFFDDDDEQHDGAVRDPDNDATRTIGGLDGGAHDQRQPVRLAVDASMASLPRARGRAIG